MLEIFDKVLAVPGDAVIRIVELAAQHDTAQLPVRENVFANDDNDKGIAGVIEIGHITNIDAKGLYISI